MASAAPDQLALFEPAADPTPPPAPGLRRFDDGSQRFDYELRRAARRSIGIRIADGAVLVSAPRWALLGQVERVLADKAAWVLRQLAQQQKRQAQLQQARIEWRDGGQLPYLGRTLTLRLGAEVGRVGLHHAEDLLQLPLPLDADGARIRDYTQAWMQQQAQSLFEQRSADFAQQLGVRVTAVRLSSAGSRWGSANSAGVLRLHWRLLHFSPAIVDYVVAHEVAHLREMNHGPGFWQVVDGLVPTWREARAELRTSLLPPW